MSKILTELMPRLFSMGLGKGDYEQIEVKLPFFSFLVYNYFRSLTCSYATFLSDPPQSEVSFFLF